MKSVADAIMPIHKSFETVALGQPNRIAVKYKGDRLTYEQLNRKANVLARNLQSFRVKRGDVVALSMARSLDMIIAMLAVLKCGAAYLPLDNNNPTSRSLDCLDLADVRVIIADHCCDDLLAPDRVCVNTTEGQFFENQPDGNLDLYQDSNDKAYVMFTSGSTGGPKGVVVPHRAVYRLVVDANYIEVVPRDAILQMSPISFDASTFEIWGALLNGASLVLYPGAILDPNIFSGLVKENGVTILWLTAALFHLIAERCIGALEPVKTLLAGGDVLYAKMINKVLDAYPGITVINGYGPTENTTFTCCHRMTVENKPHTTVPIGSPINGTNVHILDDYRRPVRPGDIGELFASGLGVALGYINAQDNEHAFFFDDSIDAGLIYRTGDLVRKNQWGEIEFVGRRDNQVKIRGFRISMEEVQTNILKLNYVNDAVVLAEECETGGQQLVAYLQVGERQGIEIGRVRNDLSAEIPSYMIPDLILIRDQLPISKNGKIDKRQIARSAPS